jgi:hypothetical protein
MNLLLTMHNADEDLNIDLNHDKNILNERIETDENIKAIINLN